MPSPLLSKLTPSRLTPAEILALTLAEEAAKVSYAPQGQTHVGAAFVPGQDSANATTGSNTNGENRQKLCAEKLALLKLLQALARFRAANEITLAIHTASSRGLFSRRIPDSLQELSPPPAPLTPCGACLRDIQALVNLGIPPEKINTLISNGVDTYSAPFTKLYPLATVGQLRTFIDRERKAKKKSPEFWLKEDLQTASDLATKLERDLNMREIDKLIKNLNRTNKLSNIAGHRGLKISMGRLCRSAKHNLAMPLIDFGLFSEASGLAQTLCPGSVPLRPGPQQLLGLAISVKGQINERNQNYPLFSGPDRQRIVDISALSGNVIPVIISLNNEAFIVTTIADLAPGYSSPLASSSARDRLWLYQTPLEEDPASSAFLHTETTTS
jgi:cytidine deaminase